MVRHGVTDFTTAGKLDGRGGSDPSLSSEGRRQASAAAARVRDLSDDDAPLVITSGMRRAIETGAAIARLTGAGARVDADWDEQSFGDWEGKNLALLAGTHPEQVRSLREDPDYSRPGGESQVVLRSRVLAAFDRAVSAGGTVVVVSHRKPIVSVLSHVLGMRYERIWTMAISPASLTSVEVWADRGPSVAFVNDTSHLR